MTDKEFRRLNKTELLELLLSVSEENEALKQENAELERRLAERKLQLAEAGSIAEAALKLSGIFEAAQEAAQLYLENVKGLPGEERPQGGTI